MISVRRLLSTVLAAATFVSCGIVSAQTYPSKPIRIVVGFVPGGATDIVGRISPVLYANVPFDPIADFEPVGLVANLSYFVIANPRLPANSLRELITFAKANPRKLTYGTPGNGKVKALAITAESRLAGMPNIPTASESGLPGYTADTWLALLAPGATPKAVVDRLNAEIARALQDPQLKARFKSAGADPFGGPPETLATLMRQEQTKWTKLIHDIGLKPE